MVGAYPWDLYEFGYSHTHSTSPGAAAKARCHTSSATATTDRKRWPTTPPERTRVVLHLPHHLADVQDWFLPRVRAASAQLTSAGIQSACFWWTDHIATVQKSQAMAGVAPAVDEACDHRLVTFHSGVYPKHKLLIQELQSRAPGRYKNRWMWFFSDIPFLLASRPLKTWLTGASVIWYIEWDVAWSGNLGTIITALSPAANRFGLGMQSSHCRDCDDPAHSRWQGCILGNWSSFGHHGNPARRRMCSGQIQLLWYSPRLLDELHQRLLDRPGDVLYCEATAATACYNSTWGCRVDNFGKWAGGWFGKFGSNPWSLNNELVPPGNLVSRLFHPVKAPVWEGRLPLRLKHLARIPTHSAPNESALAAALHERDQRLYGWQ